MARLISAICPPRPVTKPAARTTYTVELVTPMFGGGPVAGRLDPVTPISAKSIRGHLRFWWRATRGRLFDTVAEMAKREGEIFGTTEVPSPFGIRVDVDRISAPQACLDYKWDAQKDRWKTWWNEPFRGWGNPLTYCVFPFQGKPPRERRPDAMVEKEPAAKIDAARFTLHFSGFERVNLDVECSLWAWLNFGGIGSRTRRGCGSLRCDEFAPKSATAIGPWMAAACQRYGLTQPTPNRDWPTLDLSVLHTTAEIDPISAWKDAVGPFREFRQGAVGRKDGGEQYPKRSYWPEPEAIREATGQRLNRKVRGEHKHHQPVPSMPTPAFPRAGFGLPIIFHFKDQDRRDPGAANADPRDTQLYPVFQGKRCKRMGSPLILKPLTLQSGQAVAMVARLVVPGLAGVELVESVSDNEPLVSAGPQGVANPNLARYPKSPMGDRGDGTLRSSSGSAVEAFLSFVEIERGFFRSMKA